MLRRMQVESDDIGGFPFELRVVTCHVAFQSMRLQTRLMPDALHGVFADAKLSREFAARPVGGPIFRLASGRIQNLGLQRGRNHRRLLAWVADLEQACHPLSQESILPSRNGRRGRGESLL